MGSHPASGGYKYRGLVLRDGGLAWGLTTVRCKKKIVEKPPRNSAGFCGGGQGLSWAVEPTKEERNLDLPIDASLSSSPLIILDAFLISLMRVTCPTHHILLELIAIIIFCEDKL
jgi:hypothetical protein